MPTFDGPIENKTWTCPLCGTIYDEIEDAQACFESPVEAQSFNVGDAVFVRERWPKDPCRPFVKRTIVEVCEKFGVPEFLSSHFGPEVPVEIPHLFCHRRQYILDLEVEIGDENRVGHRRNPISQDDVCREVAEEEIAED